MKVIGKIMLGMLLLVFGLMTFGAGACAISGIGHDATLVALGAVFFGIFGGICWLLLKALIAPIKVDNDDTAH